MSSRSIDAYGLPARIASYDADMEIMHPNRERMTAIALDVLPFAIDAPVRALDLGAGTAYFTRRFVDRFASGEVVALDGAPAMIDLARARLGALASRVRFVTGDFRALDRLDLGEARFDVVLSSFALHHLSAREKEATIAAAIARLAAGGWFVNADIVVAEDAAVERRVQDLRIAGIVARAAGRDERFANSRAVRRHLDELEARDGDQPQTLAADLAILARAGVRGASVFWSELREAVTGGYTS